MALRRLAALQQRGNPSWDDLFGQVMPAAAGHIRGLLGLPPNAEHITVQFGHNSHELVVRLLAALQERAAGGGAGGGGSGGVLRVLTSEMEFYSVTRQLNRLAQSSAARVQVGVQVGGPCAL
jgi:selenocysteine lyase/cysteine desulfurase